MVNFRVNLFSGRQIIGLFLFLIYLCPRHYDQKQFILGYESASVFRDYIIQSFSSQVRSSHLVQTQQHPKNKETQFYPEIYTLFYYFFYFLILYYNFIVLRIIISPELLAEYYSCLITISCFYSYPKQITTYQINQTQSLYNSMNVCTIRIAIWNGSCAVSHWILYFHY